MIRIAAANAIFVLTLSANSAPSALELNALLMKSTFLISGPKSAGSGKISFGTAFVLGIPLKSDPSRGAYVLVTAAHVLDEIGSDIATLQLRSETPNGSYASFNYALQIRKDGKLLYTKHDSADVAAMYIDLPGNTAISLLPVDFLADDKRLEDIDLHPGDEAFCLGFPLAASTPGGFPILRTGRIASYPLVPSDKVKTIYFDLFVYGGNSGGPVYYVFDNRIMKGVTVIGRQEGILGLVIQAANSNIPEFADKPMNIGIIVPAQFVRETIAKLSGPSK